MTEAAGTLEMIAIELARVLEPLEEALEPGQARQTLAELGFELTPAQESSISTPLNNIINGVRGVLEKSAQLIGEIEAKNYGAIPQKSLQLINDIKSTIEGFDDLADALKGLGLGVPNATIDELPQRLLSFAIVNYLDLTPGVKEVLVFLDIIKRSNLSGSGDTQLVLETFDFGQIGSWVTSPIDQLKSLYDWGENGFDGSLLFNRLQQLLIASGIPAVYDDSGPLPILDLMAAELKAKTSFTPPGIEATLTSEVSTGERTIASGDDWTLTFLLEFLLSANAKIIVQPDGSLELQPPGPGSNNGGKLEIEYTTDRTDQAEKFILIGQSGGSRLEIGKFRALTGIDLAWDSGAGKGTGNYKLEGEVTEGLLLIDFSQGDGFLNTLLSNISLESNFDLGFTVSSQDGVHFHGSSTLLIKLPTHIDLGPLGINAITLGLGIEGDKFPLSLSVDVNGNLGPLQTVIEQIGAVADFRFPANQKGNLGPVDLDIGFQPPKGVGLSLDVGVVKGGGYLFFDFDREEYAGALELVFSEIVTIKAIGLITTRLPDGSKGFSLLIIISAEFTIQLGFGFVLLGVGGLLGLNRTMRLEPLAEGVRTGAVESVLFPENVIENAPRIISDLRTFFPPEEGVFLIGPMAKLGWGTPTLISVSLGIIIEIPGNIAILGILKVALPDERAALIIIQVNFIGAIEFDKERLWFFATLFESRVLFTTIEGGMGLLVGWGSNGNFVVSVGGFHPRYNPPELPFPAPDRLSFNIINQPVAKIKIEAYFAVTSNTVQFGARLDLQFGLDEFGITGHLAFDALFQFSPFYFIIQLSGSLSVKVFGIGLFSVSIKMSLEGPTPYRAKGSGKIKLLFFKIKVNFDITWGEEKDTELPPVEVIPLLEQELLELDNWKAELPDANNLLVSLRKLEEDDGLVLHPVGFLRISQRKVPLDLTLDKFGSQKPSDANKFSLGLQPNGLDVKAEAEEQFAIAQFQEMDDQKKLSQPDFEMQQSGLELSVGGQQLKTGLAVKRIIRYEKIIIDTNFKRFVLRFFNQFVLLFTHFLKGNAVTKLTISQHQQRQKQPFEEKIRVDANAYTVANVMDNTPFNGGSTFRSQASAREYLNDQIAQNPNLQASLHIIPENETTAVV